MSKQNTSQQDIYSIFSFVVTAIAVTGKLFPYFLSVFAKKRAQNSIWWNTDIKFSVGKMLVEVTLIYLQRQKTNINVIENHVGFVYFV